MSKIADLVDLYKNGEIDFESLLAVVPTLEWGTRREENGEIWWEGENTVGDVDILWYENVISDEEREAIFSKLL